MGGSSEAAEVGCRIISTVDVLVVGGGPAGIGAAVGAAYHENLRVAIVDEGGCFGGAVPKSLITFAEGGVVCSGDQLLIKGRVAAHPRRNGSPRRCDPCARADPF